MKSHLFVDVNKRAAVIFANQYLIAHCGRMLVIPKDEVLRFKKLLVKYYGGEDESIIASFLKAHCWRKIN